MHRFIIGFVLIFFTGSWHTGYAQYRPQHPEAAFPLELSLKKDYSFHASISPCAGWDSASVQSSWKIGSKNFRVYTKPILTGLTRVGSEGTDYRVAGGINAFGKWGRLLSFQLQYALNYLNLDTFNYPDRLREAKIVPHYGPYAGAEGNGYLFHDFRFNLSLHPFKYIDVEAGIGKHQFGEGYRSIFLSANAPAYPYFKTTFKFWHIQYVNMVTAMKDYWLKAGFDTNFKKYAAMHYLSWNATRFLNFNLFEAVVWDKVDTISQRSLDINYLNPVIFFRPLEYNLGSPDNVLMGIGTCLKVTNSFHLYGQFLLDEFNLKQIKAGKQWWANKYALQAGFKLFDIFGLKPFLIQGEYTMARPFTYSHSWPVQNYGYWLQPLAHPLGSNFREIIGIMRYSHKNWNVHIRLINSWKGEDPDSTFNLGNDIYKSSQKITRTYGNTMLQGNRSNLFIQEIKLSRTLMPSWGFQAELTASHWLAITNNRKNSYFLTLGFRTLLFEEDKLF